MEIQLQEIAIISLGYAFRTAIVPDEEGELCVLQAKDLVRGALYIGTEGLVQISANLSGYVGYLKKNDVLLVARGLKAGAFRAAVFNGDEQNVIASASVLIIRITAPEVLPEYLVHYLNSTHGQSALTEVVTGSYIGALPRNSLEKIKVPIPTIQKQKAIVDLHRNIQEQQRILDRTNEIKQGIINATFKKLISK